MFSMGGSVPGHHGVGITSGMKYNKGGSVQATYGVGNNAIKKTGPDGRQREAHYAGIVPFLKGLGNLAAFGVPKLFNKQAMKYGYKGADAIKDYALKNKKALDRLKAMKIKAGASADDAAAAVQKEILKRTGVQGVGRTQTALNYAAPSIYLGGLGAAGLERAGVIDPERTNLEKAISDYSGLGVDYLSLPGLGAMYGPGLLDKPGEDKSPMRTLTEMIAGKDGTAATQITPGAETPGTTVAKISEEDRLRQEFAQRKALYQELMQSKEKPNNLGVLGRSLIEASEALNQGKGYITAGNVFGTGLADENDRRAERDQTIADAAATQAITDVMGSSSARDAAVTESVLSGGGLDPVRVLDAIDQARAAGIPLEDIPKDGNKEDVDAMKKRPGSVFMDTQGIIGQGIFVAVNQSGVINSFNNVEAAIAFASST